ncbi:hypothetical protein Psta_2287 [Pirellula staleyi DSM 6068]|uniref:AB hydrolase-1 domain-containing protein n=1 Tax=Pirellula staleyi (strain ATCC 27377 / DSM 6068 / ICPB 4128) TaxID=530564 RepID=D2R3K3_PIRSD|nr:alpha/beta fold hydrolase [Pirellula staleyi]ADB16957.1 hypothetical protein Psta_2287 [Pirellula staleyi DSM 6068]
MLEHPRVDPLHWLVMRPTAVPISTALFVALAIGLAGCSSLQKWRKAPGEPFLSAAQATAPTADPAQSLPPPGSVERYFEQCAQYWFALQSLPASHERGALLRGYNAALGKLLTAACEQGRFDPERGLVIVEGDQSTMVPVDYEGFAWNPSDFQRWHLPPHRYEPLLRRRYQCDGIGFPLVVERARCNLDPVEERFYPERSYFSATPVLRFRACEPHELPAGEGASTLASQAELTFYNPHQHPAGEADDPARIAQNLSAAQLIQLQSSPRTYFAGFVEPAGGVSSAELDFVTPYQPGKIPVVLIHGLYSDPLSWADMSNDLRSVPEFNAQYQLWTFRYPTGQGFLQSATALRRELRAAVELLDPEHSDPALRQMILVGHSMGGLVAKLQITHSEELIWNRLANRPLEEIVTTDRARRFLSENCFFDPAPHVSRVIFIATPHAGSLMSSTLVGRGASLLVDPAPEQVAMLEQLTRDNPATFDPRIGSRLPTSIDMLSPHSPLLEVMRRMQIKHDVKLHSILGCAKPFSLDGPSDGVVSVRSATHPWVESELAINAPHADVHRTIEASEEVLRILRLPPTSYRHLRFVAPRASSTAERAELHLESNSAE